MHTKQVQVTAARWWRNLLAYQGYGDARKLGAEGILKLERDTSAEDVEALDRFEAALADAITQGSRYTLAVDYAPDATLEQCALEAGLTLPRMAYSWNVISIGLKRPGFVAPSGRLWPHKTRMYLQGDRLSVVMDFGGPVAGLSLLELEASA